ncbi:MAG TPA: glucoamylase family protein [Anaerolineales bacterium]|nr:glucoamylase family protein [Anaerolineales bacterium]
MNKSVNYILTSEQDKLLDHLQRDGFQYFIEKVNPSNGLIADSTWENNTSSIAAVGFALACYPVAVEHGWISRRDAVARTLITLRFFASSPQGPEPDATGYQGFYYHFLDLQTGQRTWKSELSTIDTTYLLCGMLTAAKYFDQNEPGEQEIRRLADSLFARVNWQWAQNGEVTVTHGWRPESGFLKYRWWGYDEAIMLYLLALGAPKYSLARDSYTAYTSTYHWETHYGYELLYAGPLFIHHFSHVWVDFRGLQDDYMRARGIDYFENSRRATYVHQQHAIQNPSGFEGYGEQVWGITASEGPIRTAEPVVIAGRTYYGYLARGVPGPDDGTLSPWTTITALPFAPEIALPAIEHIHKTYPQLAGRYGMKCSLNPTFRDDASQSVGWFSDHYYGINEGPVVLMIENYRSGLIWRLLGSSSFIQEGLKKAGYRRD